MNGVVIRVGTPDKLQTALRELSDTGEAGNVYEGAGMAGVLFDD